MNALGSMALLAGVIGSGIASQVEAQVQTSVPSTQAAIGSSAQEVRPLKEGQKAPVVALRQADGESVSLARLYTQKPSVLIFYRGGWCPYCNTHLGQIAKVEPELVKLGYQVLAISPDRPEELKASLDKADYQYQLLSDSDMAAAKAFGLAFRVDDGTVEKYRGFGIDLEKASGQTHHLLPVPAVYIIGTDGVIRFAFWDADYKVRLEPEKLLAAARGVAAKPSAEAGGR